MRVIRTCKEMGIKTVAVYSKADEESLHVRFADEAVCIGPSASSESYLKPANIIAAAEITNADAIHPGYGFLSENSKFSKICHDHNIKFIGASPDMIDKMGDKSSAKETMKKAMTHAKKDKKVTAWVTAKEINKPIDFDSELYTKPLVTFLDGRSVVRKFGKKDKRKGFINTKYNVKLKPKEGKLLDSTVAKEWSAEQKTKAWYRP